jgi:hypothetical protein
VQQTTPSHASCPSSSPATVQEISTIRPTVELCATTSFTAERCTPPISQASVASSITV